MGTVLSKLRVFQIRRRGGKARVVVTQKPSFLAMFVFFFFFLSFFLFFFFSFFLFFFFSFIYLILLGEMK